MRLGKCPALPPQAQRCGHHPFRFWATNMNKNLHRLPLLGLAAATLLACVPAYAAQGIESFATAPTDLLSSQAELSNFRYTLIDLDPADGIAPAITFVTPLLASSPSVKLDAMGSIHLAENTWEPVPTYGDLTAKPYGVTDTLQDVTQMASGALLPSAQRAAYSTDGMSAAAVGSTYLTAATRMSAADVVAQAQYVREFYSTSNWIAQSASSVDAGTQSRGFNTFQELTNPDTGAITYVLAEGQPREGFPGALTPHFVLSPNTQVVFEGDLNVKIQANLSQYTLDVAGNTSAAVVGRVYAEASWEGVTGNATEWATMQEALNALQWQSLNVDAGYYPGYIGQLSELQDYAAQNNEQFKFTLSNSGAQEAVGHLYLSPYALAEIRGVSDVPESSTFALMGLGLIGISLVARRRQPAQA